MGRLLSDFSETYIKGVLYNLKNVKILVIQKKKIYIFFSINNNY